MQFSELILQRQSVRKYSSRPVPTNDILKCMEAARMAPSASNSQPWYFVIANEPEIKNKLAESTITKGIPVNKFTLQAPVIIALVIESPKPITRVARRIKNRDFPWIDAGIAAEHFCLQATELGLGTCMIGWFNEKRVKKILNIPSSKRVGLLITLGYPEDGYLLRQKSRKTIEQIVGFNTYKME